MQDEVMTVPSPYCRWITYQDIAEVVQIEMASFYEPWNEDDFRRFLRGRHNIGQICEIGEQVVGFMLYELCHNSFTIAKLAVRPDNRSCGIGRSLVEKLSKKLTIYGRDSVQAEVRETNLDAQLFLKALGFRWTETLRRHRDGEDCYRMVLHA